ncbi:MAG: hypothetical protein HOD43_09130 [Candidatus Marinimicrobia bacterium]|jgi:alpha-L-fucosidase|nr:hypothetical protein [Candidatus Neomarinimicrobiota bacterium]MBT3823617.1 hypothetical protein [Candidatus Neomarinimicrobiota bacterium]MBT4129524.1 hypothetical protein [Candidatus Neomarinimicrobiota bacterium]MBT4295950.1 hypothetical protein [Candidatus Neomarinimicrobiota bacterium]MBT4420048.1 hypothetical protein [Candidatus Neomarinimicrobiota bacterium]
MQSIKNNFTYLLLAVLSLAIIASCAPEKVEQSIIPEPVLAQKQVTGPYEANWESLSKDEIPEWMKDAKFGVYTHWGIYSVVANGGPAAPLKSMYKREFNKPEIHDYMTETYGKPEDFGYIDLIPQFTADKFDAEEWVEVMADAGAKFGGICVVHHDGFLLWDSKVNRWNSKNMGPKRDIFGEITKAVRARGDMKLAATFHHGRTYGFATGGKMEKWTEEDREKFDLFDPQYSDFYWHDGHSTREDFSNQWRAKIIEVVDNYQPDFIWFDGLNTSMKNDTPPVSYVQEAIAHFFNKADARGQEVVVANKHAGKFNFPDEFGLLSYENGRDMLEDVEPWFLIDRAIAYPWAYEHNKIYKDKADYHTRSLIDLVSRGGVFLLSLTPKGDGSIPEEEKEIMQGIGAWLRVNGEAIYSTRPWKIFGEGPTKLATMKATQKGVMKPGWNYRQEFSPQDIRFTQSKDGKTLYATTLNWPESGKIIVHSLNEGSDYFPGEISSVEMLGNTGKIEWKRTAAGLEISFPDEKPCDIAYAFKIQ